MDLFDRIMGMFTTVAHQGHGSVLVVFFIGILFGGIIQYSRVDTFEKIAGFAMLKDTTVPKMLFLAIGITSIGLFLEIKLGYASYHIKPIILSGLIIGGLLFGASMAIFGKCPGTAPVSIAEGRIDVLVGVVGGLFGGYVFTYYYDSFFKAVMGESYGKETLLSTVGNNGDWAIVLVGILFIIVAIKIPNRELLDEEDLMRLSQEERAEIESNTKFEIIK